MEARVLNVLALALIGLLMRLTGSGYQRVVSRVAGRANKKLIGIV